MRFLIGALGRGLKELWIGLLFVASVCGANAAPVITEIMYHPVGHPGEDTREEWLEIYNPDASVADLSGWKLDRGIRFEFPPDTALESGQFLVVASNVDTFTAAHPDFAGRIVGGWKGKLGNSADAVELVNAAGERVDLLDYATRGDWGQRSLADLDGSWRGWIWLNPSDGEGASLEKIQAMLGGSSGQNWRSSIAAGGTPGTANSVAEIDIAPVIQKVTHQPIIPSPNQTVTIRATVSDDAAGGAVKVVLHWRPDGTELFTLTEMADGDGDGRFEASVPAHSDTTVVEYYIEATDAGGLARTWPAPARTVSPQDLIDGAEPAFGNVTNALYQVDASHLPDEPWQPRHHPLYRIIMTEAERADFESLQRQSGFNGPTSEFNATFVSQDGTGIKVRQSCSIRDRGYSSRFQTPYSFHVGIPDDTPWNGKTSFQLNSQYAHSQALGALVFQLAGLPSIEVVPVQVFINGVDSAVSRPGYNVPAIKGYGRYVRAEPVNGEWIARLFPDDADGNLYRMDDHAQLGRGPQLGYGGETADGFRATYFKKTNADADDWTDVIELGKATSNGPDQGYREALEQELDVDQWVRYLACNALMENLEGGLLTGRSDDFAIYRGVKDPRFILLPHDLDTTMGIGERESGGTGSLYGSYSNLKGLQRFFTDSEMHSLYRASLVDLAQTVFTSDVLDPVIDDLFTDWLPDSVISNAKRFVRLRHDRVLSRFSVDTNSVAVAFLPELADGVIQANGGDVQLSGNHLPGVKSILVDGKFGGARVNGSFLLPEWWLLVPGFQPGFHVMNVEFYSGTSGQGELMEQQFVDLFTPGTVTMVEGGWPGGESVVRWDKSTDAWRITKNFTVPEGGTLTIDPGVSVYFDRNVRLRVASGGVLRVLGDPEARVTLTHFPEADAVDDPLLPGTQQAAPKWGGILFEDSMSAENLIRNADFLNAQPGDNQGCIGVVRSECVIEGCTFRGTHRRMVYGKNCSITVDGCIFPDMFAANENPAALGFDNVSEQLKIESPGLTQEGFRDGLPIGGYLRVYRNHFYGNKGHNDVMDVDSGFLGRSPVLDCRYNHFHGHVGDEHIDLGGDAYIASNIFENGTKDPVSSDRGYSNAISSGDRGKNTTIVVARNVFHSVDHAVNCKAGAAVIFEHNTSLAFHDDYEYTSGNFRQNVLTSAVNLFITEDIAPTRGDGAYLGFNVFHGSDSEQAGFPRLISGADLASTGRPTSKIEFFHNLIDPLLKDATIGPQHTGDIFATENGEGNINGIPSVNTNIVTKWSESSPARGAAAFGLDYGHTIPEWTYTRQLGSTPRFLIGGPGIFAYRWRIADATASDWSDPIDIGSGPGFPRDVPTVRTAMLDLSMLELESGNHVLEIIGQDFAGNWQPEAIATKIEWTTRAAVGAVLLSEVMAAGDDFIELANIGTETVDLSGWIVSERSTSDGGFVIPAGTLIEQGSPVAFAKAVTGIGLNRGGDTVFLFDSQGALVDSVEFGLQVDACSIGRSTIGGSWQLCIPTPDAENIRQPLGLAANLSISEFLAAGDVFFDYDWVELANSGTLPVALRGVRLTDNITGSDEKFFFAPLSFLAPDSYTKFIADNDPSAGANHLDFSLDAESEHLALFDGETLIDYVVFASQTADHSLAVAGGRVGSGTTFPTDGFAATGAEMQSVLRIAQSLRISEIMSDPLGGAEYEFLEFVNVGSEAIDLTGVRITDGVDFTFPPVNLDPGGYVIIVSDAAKFAERYGSDIPVIGEFTGQLNNAGERIIVKAAEPFGAHILDFSYEKAWLGNVLGHSLEIAAEDTPARLLGDVTSWQISADPNGSPRGSRPVIVLPATPWSNWAQAWGIVSPDEDADRDGMSALIEYAFGINPTVANPVSPHDIAIDGDRRTLHASFPIDESTADILGRPDLVYRLELSSDLKEWSALLSKQPGQNWSGTGWTLGPIIPQSANRVGSITLPDGEALWCRLVVALP